MRKIWAFFIMSLKNQAGYRAAMYVYFVSSLFHTGTALLTWLSAENSQYTVFTKGELIGYYLILLFLDAFIAWFVFGAVAEEILKGEVLTYFTKPVSYIRAWIGMELGFKTIGALIYLIGAVCIIGLFIHFKAPLTIPLPGFSDSILLIFACLIAIALSFLQTFILGLFAFWFTEVQFLDYIYFTILPFLSGDIVPLAFLPAAVQNINMFLPFRYQMSLPLEIIFHKTSVSQSLFGIGVGIVWIGIYILLYKYVWKKGCQAYMAFGH